MGADDEKLEGDSERISLTVTRRTPAEIEAYWDGVMMACRVFVPEKDRDAALERATLAREVSLRLLGLARAMEDR